MSYATHRRELTTLFNEFDDAIAEAIRIRTEFIRTELELGFTFLDAATKARGPATSQQSIRNAIKALANANRFLAHEPRLMDTDNADIRRRRNELRLRLREFLGNP